MSASTKEAQTFTPGPWNYRQFYNVLRDEIGVNGRALATVWVRKMKGQKDDTQDRAEPWAEGEANARLIAAAPEMFAMLRELASMAESDAALFNDDSLMKPFYIVQAEKIRALLKKCARANSKEKQ